MVVRDRRIRDLRDGLLSPGTQTAVGAQVHKAQEEAGSGWWVAVKVEDGPHAAGNRVPKFG